MLLASLVLAAHPDVQVQWRRDGDLLTKIVIVDGEIHRVSAADVPNCTVAFDVADKHRLNTFVESPAPGSPNAADAPDGWQASYVAPVQVMEHVGEASPIGWSHDRMTEGNNVVQGSFTWPGVGPVITLPPFSITNQYEFDPTLPSLDSYESIGVHLFSVLNAAHDWFWHAGFQEADGCAQQDNFGRGGVGGDPVLVEVLHNYGNPNYVAGCYCNAEDGQSPVLQFWNWFNELLSPDRHSALDAGIVVHEYAHIVTARLVGIPVNADGSNNVQGRALAEGISDAFALLWQAQPEDDPAWAHTIGAWPSLNFIGNGEWHDNYYFGVRTYPYSTNTQLSPKHLGHFDLDANPLPPDIPSSPLQIVQENGWHELGEIYASFLWDVWAIMRDRYGFDEARDRMTRTIVLSEKLAPILPDFGDMRDAFLEADDFLSGGENWILIWHAAAKRGLGAGAVIPDSAALTPVAPSFETVDFADWNRDGVEDILDAVAFEIDTVGGSLKADVNLDHRVDVLDWLDWWHDYAN